jgi:glycosyltransferase involved in cell wall biosynthesis
MKSVSFIVPVSANRIDDIPVCVSHLLLCGLKDYEIIVVVNGTESISCPFDSNSKVTFLTTTEVGPSVARNIGIQSASGKWLCFVDSDDTLLPGAVPEMMKIGDSDSADYVLGDFRKVSDEHVLSKFHLNDRSLSWEGKALQGMLNDVLRPTKQMGFVWGKIYRKDFLQKNKIIFDKNLLFGEDYEFALKTGFYANKISYVPVEVIEHYVNLKSLTKEYNRKYLDNNILMLDSIKKDLIFYKNNFNSKPIELERSYKSFSLMILSTIIVDYVFHPDSPESTRMKFKKLKEILQLEQFTSTLHWYNLRDLGYKHKMIILFVKLRLYYFLMFSALLRHKILHLR